MRTQNFFLSLFLVMFLINLTATKLTSQPIDRTFFIWLLNNESKFMSILANDRFIIDKISCPFSFLFVPKLNSPAPEQFFWNKHNKFYNSVQELSKIITLTQRLHQKNLSILFKKITPGPWLLMTIQGTPVGAVHKLGPLIERSFRESLLKTYGVESLEEVEVANRVEKILKNFTDIEKKLMMNYLENVNALYPRDKSAKILTTIVKNGIKRDFSSKFATSIKDFVFHVRSGQAKESKVSTESEVKSYSDNNSDEAFFADMDMENGSKYDTEQSSESQFPTPSETLSSSTEDVSTGPKEEDLFNILE